MKGMERRRKTKKAEEWRGKRKKRSISALEVWQGSIYGIKEMFFFPFLQKPFPIWLSYKTMKATIPACTVEFLSLQFCCCVNTLLWADDTPISHRALNIFLQAESENAIVQIWTAQIWCKSSGTHISGKGLMFPACALTYLSYFFFSAQDSRLQQNC